MAIKMLLVSVVCCCFAFGVTKAQDNFVEHDDLAITLSQKKALDKFKESVSPKLPHDYMKEDIYLIRWLRARDFDLKSAEEFLLSNLKWREENKMDTIHTENWDDIVDDFPVFIDTYDKKGQPVITATAGQWNFRDSYITGRDKRVFRYVMKILDQATNMVREGQQKGKNITRFDYLLNLDGFNPVQHGCPRCLLSIIDILRSYENYFPGMIDKIIIINAPPTIRVVFGPLVRSAVNPNTIGSVNLKILGTDKNEWKRYLLKIIDENQLTEELGGKRVRK